MVEMMVSLAIALVMATMALPYLYGNRRSYHLTSASTNASGAIQATRYNAIMTGCPFSITFNANTTTYVVQELPLTGTPPACASSPNWQNYPLSDPNPYKPWSTSGDVSVGSTVTLQFCPNGTMTDPAVTPTCGSADPVVHTNLIFSNGFTTNTLSISGVGNVKVSQP